MRTTQDYEVGRSYAGGMPADTGGTDVTGTGWVMFAAVMLGLAGIWNFFAGIAAIAGAHVYAADAHYIFSDLNTWGWIVLFLGAGQVLAALALLSGSEFARWFGVGVAALNALGQLSFAPAYPLWALLMFTIDILIIYALVVYGGSRLRGM